MNTNADAAETADVLITGWGKIHNTIIAHLSDTLGSQRTRELLEPALRKLGRDGVRDKTADTAVDIARVLMDFEQYFGMEPELVKKHRDHVIREIPSCPWSYFRPESCEVLAAWVQGICEGLNPAYEYLLTKAIPRGDRCCTWEIRRRSS